MQHSRIKARYEKQCELCETHLKWEEKPICLPCLEALKQLIKEKKEQNNKSQQKK